VTQLERTPWVKISSRTEEFVSLEITCYKCSEVEELKVSVSDFNNWDIQGNMVQYAFPELDKTIRELFISGICGICWEKMFNDYSLELFKA
jgi:hypothetical protein